MGEIGGWVKEVGRVVGETAVVTRQVFWVAMRADRCIAVVQGFQFGLKPSTSSRSHSSIKGQSVAQVPKSAM